MYIKQFRSPNFYNRIDQIRFIVIHYTEINFMDALHRLCDIKSRVSSHYLIKEDGTIYQLVDDQYAAWHAGDSQWFKYSKLNHSSIGIELDNPGTKPFTETQILSCIQLCTHLKNLYSIPKTNIIGHSDIAPNRKIDPGIFFDWQLLSRHDLGIFHSINCNAQPSQVLYIYGDKSPDIAIMQHNLQKLGYNIHITGVFDNQTNFVIRAFQSKFNPQLLHKLGTEFYQNPSSQYKWDKLSDQILHNLILNNEI